MQPILTEPTLDWLAALNTLAQGHGFIKNKQQILALAWRAVEVELRTFGLDRRVVDSAQTGLAQPLGKTDLNYLSFAFLLANLHTEENVFLILPADGEAFTGLTGDILYNEAIGVLPGKVLIFNLNEVWSPMFSGIHVKEQSVVALRRGELEVLSGLRVSGANRVEVKADARGVTHITESFEFPAKSSDLSMLVKGLEFGEVSVKVTDGKAVYIKTEKKQKIQ